MSTPKQDRLSANATERNLTGTQERDLMRKLKDDIAAALDRNYSLCEGLYTRSEIYTMQINVIAKVIVYYFVKLYGEPDYVVPFMKFFVNNYKKIDKNDEA